MPTDTSILRRLALGRAKLPLILQTEAAECGLACVAMVAGFHGHRTDLSTLRRQHALSLTGTTLADLMTIAGRLKLGVRPLRLELDDLGRLRLPCILHWNLDHFVVLKRVSPKTVTILDPAVGERTLSLEDVSRAFSGIALELWPGPEFKRVENRQRISIRGLVGRVHGLARSVTEILLLAAALEVVGLCSPLFLQWVLDEAVVAADLDLLAMLAVGFGLLVIVQQILAAVRSWAIVYLDTAVSAQWRANVFAHLIRLPVQYFVKRHLGDLVSRFNAVDQIQKTVTTAFLEAVLDGVMAITTLVMMLIYSPLLTTVTLGIMAVYALLRWFWHAPLMAAMEEEIVHTAKQQSHFLETLRGIRTIKLFQRQEQRRIAWVGLAIDEINAQVRMDRLHVLYKTTNGLLLGLENIAVIWLGARMAIGGEFTVGMLIAFNAYRTQFNARVGALIERIFEIGALRVQAERLADIVLTEPEPELAGANSDPIRRAAALAPMIEVAALRFRYGDSDPYILDGVNFTVDAGESVAIVGPSGSGKTTLLNVLLGLLPPSEGDVRIGGVSVLELGSEVLRRLVGTVLQDDVLFAGSIADNISFFDPQADSAWIEECARMAAIADEISLLPMGYNTLIGDMGSVLSGGQKQRILLARALYKRPAILFLDEATSHLDVVREKQVNQAVASLQMTRVIIAHRAETIATADRVITLSGGVVSGIAKGRAGASDTGESALHRRYI